MDTARVKTFLTELQELIVERLEQVDGKAFQRDGWQRPEGGGGLSCVMEEGNVFERGGVNFSHVFGAKLPSSASANRPELAGRGFEAMGAEIDLEHGYISATARRLSGTRFVFDVVTVTGTLAIKKDFGAGYSYEAILEKATIK